MAAVVAVVAVVSWEKYFDVRLVSGLEVERRKVRKVRMKEMLKNHYYCVRE